MKKVLVVEDEMILREAYYKVLSYEGYLVYLAGNGNEALEYFEKYKPDLILLDILMPEIDGVTFLKKMDNKHQSHHPKVITFSNLSDQSKLEKMSQLGASEHILKSSLSPKQLVGTVKRVLGE